MDTTVQDTMITPLDLNQATYEELVALPYIGEVLAQRILDYRKEHGGFSNLEELLEVQGIHQNAYEGLRGLLTVSPVQEPPVDELPPEVAFTPPEEPEAVPSPEPEAVPSPELEATTSPEPEPIAPEPSSPPVRASHNWAWLWGALLGGFLGMIFSLLVLAGINGSLDVGDSNGMRRMRQQMDNVSAKMDTLQTQVDTLQQQLTSLKDTAARVERLETSSAALEQEVGQVSDKLAAINDDLSGLSDDVNGLSEQVTAVQEQAQQTTDFFTKLRDLLNGMLGTPQSLTSPVALPLLGSGGSQ